MYLGAGSGSSLPECTNNTDPMLTADHQNAFFINKIEALVTTMPSTDKSPESPNTSVSTTDLSTGKGGKLSKWLSPSQGGSP